jgi:putative transposon-encoded protein
MPQTIINENELLETIKTRVGSNGQISVGKKHAGKQVTAYVVEVQEKGVTNYEFQSLF